MTISAGALSYVALDTEVTWGTAIASPVLAKVPYTAFSMNVIKDVYTDESIQADRMERYAIHGNQHVQGELSANFSHANFDGLLESLLNSTFSTNVLKTGTTRKSFLVEEGHADIGKYITYKGVVVDKLTLTVPVSGIVTSKFTMIGKDMTLGTATVDANASLTASTARQPYVHNGGTFNEGGGSVAYLTSITLNIDNGYTTNFSLGNNYARDLSVSFAKITGSVNAYFEDTTMYNKFLAETSSSISFTLTDGTNTMAISLPNVKYTGGTKSIGGQGPVSLEMPFVGLYDSGTSTNVSITRSA